MQFAVKYIQDGIINVDNLWTKGYNRSIDYKQAFEDGLNRDSNYIRGYLEWK
jgi:hypothetical protein